MALVKAAFAPGIDKQTTTYGAEGKWVDSKNVRFRTGLPEKIGGWSKVVPTKKIAGCVFSVKSSFSFGPSKINLDNGKFKTSSACL